MATVTTRKPVNPSQLGVELGRVALRVVGPHPDGVTRITAYDVPKTALNTAVAAHTAVATWKDPEYVAAPDPDALLKAVRAKAQQVADGNGAFTLAQVQQILAALVLRGTR